LAGAEIAARRQCRVLADVLYIGFVNRAARDEAEHRGARLPAVLQQGRSSGNIDAKHLRRILGEMPVMASLRQMRNGIDMIRQVSGYSRAFQIPENIRAATWTSGPAGASDAKHVMPCTGQLLHKLGADEAAPSGYKHPHAAHHLSGFASRT